jgi:DNA adenine methylase
MNITRYSSACPLRRLGKKNEIAPILAKCVPENFNTIISLFCGTGSFEFNFIDKVSYLFLNDLDSNAFNLYQVLNTQPDDLIEEFEMLPTGSDSWNYFKKTEFETPLKKAVKFLYLSNFGYMGMSGVIFLGKDNSKKQLQKNIKNFVKHICGSEKTTIQYLNCDFEKVFDKISFQNKSVLDTVFTFADPPYLDCANNYDTPEFTLSDHERLQNYLINSGTNFMICEFDNPEIIELSEKNNLFITEIAERRNMVNRRTEIIITNYPVKDFKHQKLF